MSDTYLDLPFSQRWTGELRVIYCNNGTIGCTEAHISENDRECYVGEDDRAMYEYYGITQKYPKKPLLDRVKIKYPIVKIEWRRT